MPTSPASSNSPPWQPTASLAALRLRASLLAECRAFFAARGLLEVETPQLSAAAATDLHLESLQVRAPGGGLEGWLHTSPEFPMKRLLAAGVGDCWQLARVFRGGEQGRRHNPEFSLLEWYRVGWDAARLMDEVDGFLRALAAGRRPLGPTARLTYREAFRAHAGFDPFAVDAAGVATALRAAGVAAPAELEDDLAAGLDLALALLVEPALDPARPTFIHEFPASHAALARVRPGDPPVAERFELFLGGMELANGFHELTDAAEQRSRFSADLAARTARGLAAPPVDGRLLAALEHGLPACAGVALGFDRLVMLLAGADDIRTVLAFGWGDA
ncbi:EF-P lysine aminoacylase EpmA [Thioalkalivibrio sp. XN8]|uniref:EF-P lysine aminoacylase EpmA n=1 Tax=Thioalkalivibrio sp. XN8 TaxID=2712863 RepID=UPI0013ED0988|nr:EF-P lysine aminoacylase GenX [Thioalkalivibrio sp. XN8]